MVSCAKLVDARRSWSPQLAPPSLCLLLLFAVPSAIMSFVALVGLVFIDVSEVTVWLPTTGDVLWVACFRALFSIALAYAMGYLWSMEGVRLWLGWIATLPAVIVLSALSYCTLMVAPFIIWCLATAFPMTGPEPIQVSLAEGLHYVVVVLLAVY
jgi:hypothetical protein